MKNRFDFKDLMSFGMFLLALLTFIILDNRLLAIYCIGLSVTVT